VRVRLASPIDIPTIVDLERASTPAAHWPRHQYETLFVPTRDRPSESKAWVVEDESGMLAFLVARRVGAEWELENIVVAEGVRRRGVATLLLDKLVAHARAEQGSGIFLEVRASNEGARALYRKAGFEEVGLRKSYYANPCEDAILGRLRL
jgi:[ribosomal protein S18]-alanine N-acetyltransferase